MRIKEVGYIVERLADRFRDFGGQMAGQEAAHKAALTEIRASFNARTGADEKLIEDRRMEIIRLNGANDRLNDLLRAERLAHRDEVAALQERLRASIARGDFAQMEVAALKSQTPKHPVKVGEWVRRTSFEHSIGTRIGAIAQVIDMDDDGDYEVAINGTKHCWSPKYCTPCDPPEATPVMPKPGDMVRLVFPP